jgi:excisionase family DNA binding protein
MANIISDEVYRTSEVARILKVSRVTLSRAIQSGKLKAFRVGGQWRVLGSEVVRYIQTETARSLPDRRQNSTGKE